MDLIVDLLLREEEIVDLFTGVDQKSEPCQVKPLLGRVVEEIYVPDAEYEENATNCVPCVVVLGKDILKCRFFAVHKQINNYNIFIFD